MNCFKCHGKIEPINDSRYQWRNEFLGDFSIDNTCVEKCNKCGELLLPYYLIKQIEKEEQARLERWLLSQCTNSNDFTDKFISATELAEVLGVSRNAVHKTPKYKTLIYNIKIRDQVLYFLKSAEKYKKSKDGRFEINQSTIEKNFEYVEVIPFNAEEHYDEEGRKRSHTATNITNSNSKGIAKSASGRCAHYQAQ